MSRYQVMVDDNFHYQDPEKRREQGTYATLEEALAICRRLVDACLVDAYTPGVSAEALYEHYTSFGEDPFIIAIAGTDDAVKFSAWDYAKQRCDELCRGAASPGE